MEDASCGDTIDKYESGCTMLVDMGKEQHIERGYETRDPIEHGSFSIDMEPASSWAIAINAVLKKNRKLQRFLEIGAGNMGFAEGIWTEDEAREVIKSARVGSNGVIYPGKKFYQEGKVGRNESFSFWVDKEIVALLVSEGTFRPKKRKPDEYKLIYPDWLVDNVSNNYNADIKCQRAIWGKTKVTIILIPVRY